MPQESKMTISVGSERPCGGFHHKISYIHPIKGSACNWSVSGIDYRTNAKVKKKLPINF